jgi:transcriptional regulator with XRE-family HTH domain
MTHPPLNDPHMPLEIGQLLKQERLKQGLSIEDLCKKMGTRVQQIEAVESGSEVYFQKHSNPFIWFARLYARKLGITLSDLMLGRKADANTSQKPPLYLIKNKDSASG